MAKKRQAKSQEGLPDEFLKLLRSVTAKRAKTVIDHILEHGFITTEDLSTKYGYDHAPRAARDVREQGIPLETFKVTAANGRKIAAYRFGDPSKVKGGRHGGRSVWPKELKDSLAEANGRRCFVCNTPYELRYLQIDHRVPYEVGGDQLGKLDPAQLFLSYSRTDAPTAVTIVAALENSQFDVWWDRGKIRTGQFFADHIHSAIDRSKKVIVLWSRPREPCRSSARFVTSTRRSLAYWP